MVQSLATKYNKHIAYGFFVLMWLGCLPAYGMRAEEISYPAIYDAVMSPDSGRVVRYPVSFESTVIRSKSAVVLQEVKGGVPIDGPSQPEMASFQAAGTNNMVNLFTGDFSYNIPLLDVGGYPVNIFYSGGVVPEQEASWVGLGWNINPGNVNRNMRGVPDDFNGKDTMYQYQTMKPNKTWGFRAGTDIEIFGAKKYFVSSGLDIDLGASFNNYLGPAVEFGIKGNIASSVSAKIGSEKSVVFSPSMGVGLGANLNTRYGLTSSANASLTARFSKENRSVSVGAGLSTGFNSRTVIKGLQLYEQMGYNQTEESKKHKDKTYTAGRSFALTSNISFTRPSYTPVMRAVNTNSASSFHAQVGSAYWGFFGSIETEVYFQHSAIENGDTLRRNPMYGYFYNHTGFNDRNAVMDMTRFNDREVTQATPVISVPQYSYDVFSIQGEGTGGSIRAYRNDLGYVKDNLTISRDKSTSGGMDVGIPSHYGANFSTITTPSSIGEWESGNKLRTAIPFRRNEGLNEAVYFRSPGESSVVNPGQYDKIGGTDLVRYKLDGPNMNPTVEAVLQRIDQSGRVAENITGLNSYSSERKKRTQVVNFLTADEASYGGLDTCIKSYNPDTLLDSNKFLKYENINRSGGYRKGHHISQINVTEGDGKRYVYGIPVYNVLQKDFSFTVATNIDQKDDEFADYTQKESRTGSDHVKEDGAKDGYVQVTETPAYAHSFLLSGLLSPDYVDVTNDGITEDDLGTAIKFNYTRVKQSGAWVNHKWRTPLSSPGKASLNAGSRSEVKDDKGIVSYGERESWYLHSIESKSMIAVFRTANRTFDGKGAASDYGGVNANDQSIKKLERIDLYNKADLKKNGLSGARPVKTVHFQYSYRLCPGTPDNPSGAGYGADSSGKLTLEKIWFTYNGQTRTHKEQYLFDYGTTAAENPAYSAAASDRWGNYKPDNANPGSLKNRDYPYSKQDKALNAEYASAWSLRKILLPSGGKIEVEYEGDDYAFVQDRRAAQMMSVAGFGIDKNSYNASLFEVNGSGVVEKNYVFINVPQACETPADVMNRYLRGQTQIAFKLAVQMPKGVYEYIPCYASFKQYGVSTLNHHIIWLELETVDGLSPLSLSAVEYLREQLPGQAFKGYDMSGKSLLAAAGVLGSMIGSIGKQLKNPVKMLREEGKAKVADLTKSFARLNTPAGYKYGGGHRVKSIRLTDNWVAMNGKFSSTYGQEYNYETTEVFDGKTRTISSGVASYEPTFGGEENPFQTMMQVANQLPMGPTSYGAIEMPVMDAFFPAPVVGYSKVTVRSIRRNVPEGKKSKSGIGKQVTEYFTAKDYPVYYSHTSFDPASNKDYHKSSRNSFLNKYEFDSRALSQGFLVVTNDMHGQLKSQSSYSETDSTTRINYTRNFYRNTGENGLDEKFDFVHASAGGEVKPGNMGVDVEIMSDTREFSVKSRGTEYQGQVDVITIGLPVPIFTAYAVDSRNKNTYRAVTTTKTVSYHAVLDSVLVIDKGSAVSTRNLVYDAETGAVVVNRTNNEFNQPVYSVNYPAYWAYTGMGLAYKNIDAVFSNVKFRDGKIVGGGVPESAFESGDELLITNPGNVPAGCEQMFATVNPGRKIWAFDRLKNTSSLHGAVRDIIFIDEKGKIYTRENVTFRIIRTGGRNMLTAPLAGVSLMESPLKTINGKLLLSVNDQSKVITGSAVDYREKWQNDADLFPKYKQMKNPNTCEAWEVFDCSGDLEKSVNPYVRGLLGNFRNHRSYVFYSEREQGRNTTTITGLSRAGFLQDFELFWNFDALGYLQPSAESATSKWIEKDRVTRYNSKGMELETRDAMGIYTAAQYGYSKTMPVAIANNAQYNEILNDNFEDNNYNDSLNAKNTATCLKTNIGFRGMSNSQVVDAVASGFNAHTGKYVLAVNKNATAAREFDVKELINDSFNINGYGKDTTIALNEFGGQMSVFTRVPYNIHQLEYGADYMYFFNFGGAGAQVSITPRDTFFFLDPVYQYIYTRHHEYNVQLYQYVNVPANNTYNFSFSHYPYEYPMEGPGPGINQMGIYIQDLSGAIVASHSSAYASRIEETRSIFLCKGVYKIIYYFNRSYTEEGYGTPYQKEYAGDGFNIGSNIPSGYRDLGKEYGCPSTIPL